MDLAPYITGVLLAKQIVGRLKSMALQYKSLNGHGSDGKICRECLIHAIIDVFL